MAAFGEGSGAAGGFAVPEEFRAEYFGSLYEKSTVWPLCDVVPMTHETCVVPAWDDSTSAAGSMFGGLTASITSEGSTITESTGQMRAIKLQARKLATYCKSSNELESDAPKTIWPTLFCLKAGDTAVLDAAMAGRWGKVPPYQALKLTRMALIPDQYHAIDERVSNENQSRVLPFARLWKGQALRFAS